MESDKVFSSGPSGSDVYDGLLGVAHKKFLEETSKRAIALHKIQASQSQLQERRRSPPQASLLTKQYTGTMKIPDCDRCLLYSHDPHLVCAVHPAGPQGDSCLDFREDPNAESVELWEPEDATYYNGELIVQPQQRLTQQQQLELLDTHPMFTGKCPQCNYEFDRDWSARVHWDCPECGWMDDSV